MTCTVSPKTPWEAASCPRPGSAARALQSFGKHSTDPRTGGKKFSVQTPLDFGLEVLSLPQWFVLPPSALQFHLLQEEEFCLKPHKIQTDVTVKSSHLLIGMRKGGRVILILHFQLTNLELGCHRKFINPKICSSLGRECTARTAPAVSKGLGSHSILRPTPHWCSQARLHQDTAEGSKTSIICCRRQEFVSHCIFFLVATWGKKTGL